MATGNYPQTEKEDPFKKNNVVSAASLLGGAKPNAYNFSGSGANFNAFGTSENVNQNDPKYPGGSGSTIPTWPTNTPSQPNFTNFPTNRNNPTPNANPFENTPSAYSPVKQPQVENYYTTPITPPTEFKASTYPSQEIQQPIETALKKEVTAQTFQTAIPPTYPTATPPAAEPPAVTPPIEAPAEDLSLTDLGAFTEGGQFVEDETLRGLNTGEFAGSQSMANRLDRNKASTDYLINKRAKEQAANSGFAPGTKQYQDILAQAQAEISSSNLAGEQALNQSKRDEFQTYMDRASGIETERFGRAVGERNLKFTREDVEYLRGKQDDVQSRADANNIINKMKDQGAIQILAQALATGGVDAFNAKMAEIIGDDGAIIEGIRSTSPIGNLKQEAEEWVKIFNPMNAGETEEEWSARNRTAIDDRLKDLDIAKRQPIDEATLIKDYKDSSIKAVSEVLAGTKTLNQITKSEWDSMTEKSLELMNLPEVTSSSTFKSIEDWEKSGMTADKVVASHKGLTGGWSHETKDSSAGEGNGSIVMHNGKPYRVIKFQRELDEDLLSATDIRGTYTLKPLKGTGAEITIGTDWEDV